LSLTDNRYLRKAYVFLRDALDYTTKQQKKTKGAAWNDSLTRVIDCASTRPAKEHAL
jgi:uncharacterized repeat protein (TIGR04138 family)